MDQEVHNKEYDCEAELKQVRAVLKQTEQQLADALLREQAALAQAEAAKAETAATRAQAEQAVKAQAESEERYRIMGETIPFGVWWCNAEGGAEYVSPSFLELLNMTWEEMRQFGWTKRLPPEDVEPMMEKWLHCIRTGDPWDDEHRIYDRHGNINTVLTRGLPVRDESGTIIAWVGVNLDITARKQVELQLKEAKEALEEALHVKDQFLANISHELRTPLTLILGPVKKTLSADNLTDEQQHDLMVVERNARTLLRNVNDLLDLSKIDAGRARIEYAETDLAWLSRFVASHFETVAAEKRVSFVVETPESLPAQIDPEKVQRILFNLLSNASKFTPEGGTVHLSLGVDDGSAFFAVEDTGPGIPEDMRQMIFERFRQVDSSSTRQYGGTGLGLAIVKEFVNLHQGTVEVTEAPDGGARFVVAIPLLAPDGAEVKATGPVTDEEAAQGIVAELQSRATFTTHHDKPVASDAPLVLVVEDNPEMNAFIAGSLGDRYQVDTAFDGEEGLEKALRLRPDLIISDIMMPRMSGDEMVREVRRHRELDDVPILLLTAKANEDLRVELLSSGAQDFLVKPFVTEELVARAADLIDRKKKAETSLRESYALLHAVTEGVTEAIFVKDTESRYLMVNTAGAQRLGVSVEEAIGHNDLELLGPEEASRIREVDLRIVTEGRTLTFEETRTFNEQARTYLTTKAPHRDHQGQIIGVLGISVDITERKHREEERERLLKEVDLQRARLQAILDSLPVGVWVTDATGKMVVVNDVARDIWGGRAPHAESVAGYEDYKAWWADTGEPITAEDMPLAHAINGERITNRIVDIERFDGAQGTQLISAAPVQASNGEIIGGVAIVQDITNLKRTEEELRKLTTELEQRVAQRTSELENVNKELEAFSYSVSHDLRAPLRRIDGFSHLLLNDYSDKLNEQGKEYLDRMRASAQRMGQLIDDILGLSRAARAEMKRQPVDLSRIAQEVAAELRQAKPERQVEFIIETEMAADADPHLMRIVLDNLLGNAWKFTGKRDVACIEFGMTHLSGKRVYHIRDNGAGFDMEDADRLFTPFQRMHTQEEFPGTGIGLALVQRIIRRHDGRIWAEAEVDKGAAFYFTLGK